MIEILLSIWLSLAIVIWPKRILVDAIEINTTPHFTQVILHRWHRLAPRPGHRVAQWWIERDSIDWWREGDRYIVRKDGVEFSSSRLHHTKTKHDPEMKDRKILGECDRVRYHEFQGKN